MKKYINKDVEVLFEQEDNGFFKGHTNNYLVVKCKGKKLENRLVNVKIIEEDNLELKGQMKM